MTPEPPLGAAPEAVVAGCAGIASRAASGRGDTAGDRHRRRLPPRAAAGRAKRPSTERRSSSRASGCGAHS